MTELAETGRKGVVNGQKMAEMAEIGPANGRKWPKMAQNDRKYVENADSGIKGSAHLSNLGTLLFGEALPPEKKCARLEASCICQSKHLCVGSAPQGSGSMDV